MSWVAGWLDWSTGNTDNTNTLFLLNAKIGPYTRDVGIYRCPADNYPVTIGQKKALRVRSNAMNGFIEGGAGDPDASPGQGAPSKIRGRVRSIAKRIPKRQSEHHDDVGGIVRWIDEGGARILCPYGSSKTCWPIDDVPH